MPHPPRKIPDRPYPKRRRHSEETKQAMRDARKRGFSWAAIANTFGFSRPEHARSVANTTSLKHDPNNLYPMRYSTNQDGTLESGLSPNAYRSFQIVSNQLITPLLLVCPADKRIPVVKLPAVRLNRITTGSFFRTRFAVCRTRPRCIRCPSTTLSIPG